MMYQNKGVTLVTLVITIVIIALIAGIAVGAGTELYSDLNLNEYVSQMNIIQSRVNAINAMINNGDTSYNNFGTEISNLSSDKQNIINTILGGQPSTGFKYFDKVSLRQLGIENVSKLVIINFDSMIIYSLQGIEFEGEIYYNQYDLPNGTSILKANALTTSATTFDLIKNNYGLSVEIEIANIVYDAQIEGGDIYYGLITNEATTPVTVESWKTVSGTSFNVTQTGKYAVKLIDKNNGVAYKYVDVVTCNAPEVATGMTPVVYENGNWQVVTDLGKWYDYSVGKWANVMLEDELVIDSNGIVTTLGSMYVWVPRYCYKITSNYATGGDLTAGTVDVKFLKNTSNVSTDEKSISINNKTGLNNWVIPAAFCNDSENDYANGGWDKEINGFWVAKFEASSTTPLATNGGGDVTNLNIRSVPNVCSWRNISIVNMLSNCYLMNTKGSYNGLTSISRTHLMKNSEWGAIAYLTISKYGRNGTNVTVNNSSTYVTGNAANSATETTVTAGVLNAYNTDVGILASSTGTIYGIYDLVGGSGECVAGGERNYILGKASSVSGLDKKYIDAYASNNINGIVGNAMYETKNWFGSAYTYNNTGIIRGEKSTTGTRAGLFGYSESTGTVSTSVGFRPVIIIDKEETNEEISDNVVPTVTANNATVSITVGDSNAISSYFTVTANGTLPIRTMYVDTSNGNREVTNTSTLTEGTHIIKCTAIKSNGLSANATVTITVNSAVQTIDTTTSRVGCYADFDDDGTVDGIIYADKAVGCNGNWFTSTNSYLSGYQQYGNYNLTAVTSGLKEYYLKGEYTDIYLGTAEVIAPVNGTTGLERFYIIALRDYTDTGSSKTYNWDLDSTEEEYTIEANTVIELGTGKTNTGVLVGNSTLNSNTNNIWYWLNHKENATDKSLYERGWYVPSRAEFCACMSAFEVTSSTYADLGFSYSYWLSSEFSTANAWTASCSGGCIYVTGVLSVIPVRLGLTF